MGFLVKTVAAANVGLNWDCESFEAVAPTGGRIVG
jgi:hypothetical protein